MNRRTLFPAIAALTSVVIVVAPWAMVRPSGCREVGDMELSLAIGSDANKSATFDGDCDSVNNPGGGTVGCDGCTTPGPLCICCDGSGLVNMYLGGAGPSSVSGVDPNSSYNVDCGNMKTATCQLDKNNMPYCAVPDEPNFKCGKQVTEFLMQKATPPGPGS